MAVVTPYLLVEDLTKSVGSKVLFSNISFAVNKGQRIALVARNGIGKSTLLDILMEKTDYDSGKITWRKDLKVRYLPQRLQGDEAIRLLGKVFVGSKSLCCASLVDGYILSNCWQQARSNASRDTRSLLIINALPSTTVPKY